jgi:hypothetical protein
MQRAPSIAEPAQIVHSYVWRFTRGDELSIDPDLIERALEVSGERTKNAAVTKALQEFIAHRRQKRLLDLFGKLEWDASYDYKSERARD